MKRLEARHKQFQDTALPHLNALYRTARQLAGEDAASDLVQDTYLRAWKYFETFDPTSNCRAWLFRILRNVSADRWRRSRLEIPWVEGEHAPEPYYDWEEDFPGQQFSGDVQQALEELPEEYRWAVLLVDVEEFSYQETAQILSCPIGTVMSRINRGRRMLARLLRSERDGQMRECRGRGRKPETEKS
ncbi:MAG: sigma-70 family RNA polymerase sigma factor [Acidobacteria bacterium]|nr:sigma-70 family RNA polymerase sigma factor [Acidobacteriota bacterium]